MQKVLQIHPDDNVLIALIDLVKDEIIEHQGRTIRLVKPVPAKHKFVTREIPPGGAILMYGVLAGEAVSPIAEGEIITPKNIRHASGEHYSRRPGYQWHPPDISRWNDRSFMGYHRSDGRVGTMNYWLFIPTVFCENRNLDTIREALNRELGYGPSEQYHRETRGLIDAWKQGNSLDSLDLDRLLAQEETFESGRIFPRVDGIKFLSHEGGCGCSYEDSETLGKLLAAYADHPNVAGVTVLSLGCQHLQTSILKKQIRERNPRFDKPMLVFEQQESGTQTRMIGQAILQTFAGLIEVNTQERKPAPLSSLCVGVKCGGSDGFSGISANPAVGYAADLIVALGGSVLLAEFPELYGAEQDLVDRCTRDELAEKFTRLMKEYQATARAVGSGFEKNPSPGNIRDGLITDAIKSLGAAKKGGTSPVTGVLDYAEPVRSPGLNLVCTPGNDVEATTGQAASGATMILFTTGLGTPTGNPVCPTIKLSTNHSMAARMPDIIDLDCGGIITGEQTIRQMGEEILEYLIRAASGEIIPRAVAHGQDDFIPWKRGVSL